MLVYESMLGLLEPEYRLPWAADIFQPGLPCHEEYSRMMLAHQRLCEKMQVQDDPDLEIIVQSLLKYAEILSLEMFKAGITYQKIQQANKTI